MKASQLLRLYPRAWRERYGDEFAALAGDAPLGASQIIDIVSGAIDARFSRDVRGSVRRQAHAELEKEESDDGQRADGADRSRNRRRFGTLEGCQVRLHRRFPRS